MEKDTKTIKQTLKRVRKTLSWSSMSKGSRAAINKSRSIDQDLEAEKEKKERELLLLVLGGAFSGKSTFVKQLRLHYGDGFPEQERVKYTNQVYDNVAAAAYKVIESMKSLQIAFDMEELQEQAEDFQKRNPLIDLKALLKQVPETEDLESPTMGANSLLAMACSELTKRFTYLNLKCNGMTAGDQTLLLTLWADSGFQECYSRRTCFTGAHVITPQEAYFLSNLKRILHERYVPSLQDILYIRKPTLGVMEHLFHMDGLFYRVIDVAGQKSQRKKWIHLFENVTAVLFFVALSAFDQVLEEDETLNSLQDSLMTFREVSHNQYLEGTDILLFLNKHDLFVEKLKTVRLQSYLPDFRGENAPEVCVKHIRELFQQNRPCHKQVYTHVSCATDVVMMRDVLANVLDIVAEINMRNSGCVF